jgi:hypothetical protein
VRGGWEGGGKRERERETLKERKEKRKKRSVLIPQYHLIIKSGKIFCFP